MSAEEPTTKDEPASDEKTHTGSGRRSQAEDSDRGHKGKSRHGPRQPRVEDMPPPSQSGPKWLTLVAIAGLLAAATFYGGYRYVADAVTPRSEPGELVEITLRPETNTDDIAKILAEKGVINRPTVFAYWSKVESKRYQAGTFKLAKNSSYSKVAEAISRPTADVVTDKLVVPEGLTVNQTAARVSQVRNRSADKFRSADESAKNPFVPEGKKTLEGVLFPATYDIKHTDSEQQIVERMSKQFELEANRMNLAEGAKAKGKTPYEIIIIASLIEKEAKLDNDRGLISQVIWNRLAKNMMLQVDATVIYAQGKVGEPNYKLTKEALRAKNPYNTYVNKGLTPTPICSPGTKSLKAAMEPTPGDYLYYVVSDKKGGHAFAKTARDHEVNVKKAQKDGII